MQVAKPPLDAHVFPIPHAVVAEDQSKQPLACRAQVRYPSPAQVVAPDTQASMQGVTQEASPDTRAHVFPLPQDVADADQS
jgi:hypothetical protein